MAKLIKRRLGVGDHERPEAGPILAAIEAGVITREQGVLARDAQLDGWWGGLDPAARKDIGQTSLRDVVPTREELAPDKWARNDEERLDLDVLALRRTRLLVSDPVRNLSDDELARRRAEIFGAW